jgi:prophage regulatory protein
MQAVVPAFMRLPDVLTRTGLKRSTLFARVKSGTFPAPVKIGPRMAGWPPAVVEAWVDQIAAGRSL